MDERRAAIRRTLAWILAGALCIAALTAIAAVLSGGFDETDGRVIGSSLGFAVFSATGASGATLRLRQSENLRTLGLATAVASGLAFVLLLLAMWIDDAVDDEALWSWWGGVTLAAFACSHASLMAGAFRPGDSAAVRGLGATSIALASLDSGIGILAIAGAFDEVDESAAQLVAVLVILMILTTALTPIVRRLQRAAPAPPAAAVVPAAPSPAPAPPGPEPAGAPAPAPFAAEVIAAADRIEALNADPGNRAPEIRREAQRLRELARLHSR